MGKRILVIEDDEPTLEIIEFLLQEEGFDVIPADTWEIVRLVEEIMPDLILMDDVLDGKFGRDLCKWLKSQSRTSNIPFILMSAAPYIERTAREACADDYLVKPFDIEDVTTVVVNILAQTHP